MADQFVIIKVRRSVGLATVSALVRRIRDLNGELLLVVDSGHSLVARLGEQHREVIAARPEVALVGAVQLTPRPVRRIRVDPLGNRLPNIQST